MKKKRGGHNKIDLTGQRFNRLVVLEEVEQEKKGIILWKCQCDCGNITTVRTANLRHGNIGSCGCYNRELLSSLFKNKKRPKEVGRKISETAKRRLIPSKVRAVDGVCYLEIYNNKGEVINETFIDEVDYEKVKQYRFFQAKPNKKKPYAVVKNNEGACLHHLIIGKPPKGFVTDHRNRNTFDNRKCNLRFVTSSQNGMNRSNYENKTSIYKGVHWDKNRNKWKTEIKLNRKARHIGRFDDEVKAAHAYNIKALELFGEYAVLNKIN